MFKYPHLPGFNQTKVSLVFSFTEAQSLWDQDPTIGSQKEARIVHILPSQRQSVSDINP